MTVALPDPSCNAGIVSYRLGKTDALLFTNAASTRRENLTLKMSFDEGATCPCSAPSTPAPRGYSTVIALDDGCIAVLYERGAKDPAERITFARLPSTWARP